MPRRINWPTCQAIRALAATCAALAMQGALVAPAQPAANIYDQRALRIGDFRPMESDRLLAYERHTDKVLETVLVFANPGNEAVTERVLVANPFLNAS